MMRIPIRRALVMMAVAAGFVALVAQPAFAAKPAGPPVCAGMQSMVNHSLADFTGGSVGRNFVSLQRVGPHNNSPKKQTNNGFHALCKAMGMSPPTGNPATMPDVDGDAVADNAELKQFDAKSGSVNSYLCYQVVASSAFLQSEGVEIQPDLSNSASVGMKVKGQVCSQEYAAYKTGGGKGIQLYPIPIATTCGDRVCLCAALQLEYDTLLQMIDAANGSVEDFKCGRNTVDTFRRNPLPLGESARLEPTGTGAGSGDPINCNPGSPGGLGVPNPGTPCPATPAPGSYPTVP
jgi:hypothetical protein